MSKSSCAKCPCGSGQPLAGCCGPYLGDARPAPTPEALMRSRYSAFVLHNWPYLLQTWAPGCRQEHTPESLAAGPHPAWVRLEIVSAPLPEIDKGMVEFKAWHRDGDSLHCLHERSRFVKLDGRWYYREGELFPHPPRKLGRNDPCPCNSGKKFKKCCG